MSKFPIYFSMALALIALGYFAVISDAAAYGGSAPETCANCHAMDAQYENWYHGMHQDFAKCTDCHLPHANFIAYYAEKGRQGAKDTFAFVTGDIPAAIRASDKTKQIVQDNCIHCHEDAAETVVMGAQPFDRYCWDCHRSVAHGDRGLSGLPYQDAAFYPTK